MGCASEFTPLRIAVLTVSDTRDMSTDTSGALLAEKVVEEGHELVDRVIVKDDRYRIRAVVSRWISEPEVQVVLISGGTGFTGRDITPEAVRPLLDREVDGFGEIFRYVSYLEIGTSSMQSRAFAGQANGTLIFALPGSTGAARTAWEQILAEQLDARHGPCNFVSLIPRFHE